MPQSPQFCGSLCVPVQVPLHRVPLLMQLHWPAWQAVPAPQRIPQSPQLELSACTSTQAPLHNKEPAGQVHCPLVHTLPAGQALPQLPQLVALDWTSTQVPLQGASPAAQTQAPPTQLEPAPQIVPQLSAIVVICSRIHAGAIAVRRQCRCTRVRMRHSRKHLRLGRPFRRRHNCSDPMPNRRSRLLQSLGFAPCVHAHPPPLHCWPAKQAMAQPPQFRTSLPRLTHAPLQGVSPLLHVNTQTPPEHNSPEGQT